MKSDLLIQKLIIEGENYRRTLEFNDGLNVINGDRYSGKSLVLKLIDYCLGKSSKIDLNVQTELGKYCDRVFLELKLKDEVYTFQRELERRYTNIAIFFSEYKFKEDYTPRIINYKKLSNFILERLGIVEHKLEKYKSHSTKKTLETISFRDIMRFIYISQHTFATNNFLKYQDTRVRYKNTPTFKVLHNLVNPNLGNVKEQIVETENTIKELEKQIRGLKSYLKDKEAKDLQNLKEQKQEKDRLLKDYKERKKEIMHKIQEHKSENTEIYNKVKTEIFKRDNKISNFKNKIEETNFRLRSKDNLLKNYKSELDELEATKEAMYKVEVTKHKFKCPLCGEDVHNEKDPFENINNVENAIEQLIKKKRTINLMINNDKEKIDILREKIDELHQQRQIFNKALDKYSKNINVPFISEIETINSLISSHNEDVNYLKELIKMHNKIAEKLLSIDTLKEKLELLQEEKRRKEMDQEYEKEILDSLDNRYRKLLNRFNFKTNPLTDYIDRDKYMPYYKEAILFNHESGGLLTCMQIAYLGAILLEKEVKRNLKYPGLLMLDTIGKYLGTSKKEEINEEIIDPETYTEIYNFLIELSKNFQLIIVDNTPPSVAKDYIKYTFHEGEEKGLINLNKNEI
ncbi:AAA family ATPase [Orenia marismortui]|uniref:Nuclease SbcCD subunit C n=1 Tax=Orenia marismortui TaxID=46469 RepID=A0A4R8GH21_9FIRM|nr:AAA family ATPase [Orenia marismortui]TDX43548.1 hypothetical protein C7959_1663 [Orenia marismortui]